MWIGRHSYWTDGQTQNCYIEQHSSTSGQKWTPQTWTRAVNRSARRDWATNEWRENPKMGAKREKERHTADRMSVGHIWQPARRTHNVCISPFGSLQLSPLRGVFTVWWPAKSGVLDSGMHTELQQCYALCNVRGYAFVQQTRNAHYPICIYEYYPPYIRGGRENYVQHPAPFSRETFPSPIMLLSTRLQGCFHQASSGPCPWILTSWPPRLTVACQITNTNLFIKLKLAMS